MKNIEKIIIHTPVRKEVCTIDSAEIVQKQRDELFLILNNIYEARGELDKLNCKIIRIPNTLEDIKNG